MEANNSGIKFLCAFIFLIIWMIIYIFTQTIHLNTPQVYNAKQDNNMIIGCYPWSEHMIKAYHYKWWPVYTRWHKLSDTLDGTTVNVSSQIFHLGLFYKFIVQHKNIHIQHRHQMNFGKWYELKFVTIDT